MALLDDILAFFTDPSWATRALSTATYTSPSGKIFTTKFINSPRSKEKKLGLQDSPKVKGTNVQDLGIKSEKYSIPVIIDGKDNDLESERFYKAFDETGAWNVMHPVRGKLKLQPVSITDPVDPIGSGNVSVMATEWMIPAEKPILKTESELKSQIDAQNGILGASAAGQLDANSIQNSAGDIGALRNQVGSSIGKFRKAMSTITQASYQIQSSINSIVRGTQTIISSTVIPVLSLAGNIKELTELPHLVSQDFNARMEAYKNLADDIFNDEPTNSNVIRLRNETAIQETFLTGILAGAALTAATSVYNSRSEAIGAITELQDLFDNTINYLDGIQSQTQSETIDKQYFTQSEAYNDLWKMMSLTIAYLLLASFNLKTEKLITIKKPENTWMFAIREYWKTGLVNQSNTDEFYDLFIATNDLNRDEIYLLPQGRKVKIYV